jgi:hypothetical protein
VHRQVVCGVIISLGRGGATFATQLLVAWLRKPDSWRMRLRSSRAPFHRARVLSVVGGLVGDDTQLGVVEAACQRIIIAQDLDA